MLSWVGGAVLVLVIVLACLIVNVVDVRDEVRALKRELRANGVRLDDLEANDEWEV